MYLLLSHVMALYKENRNVKRRILDFVSEMQMSQVCKVKVHTRDKKCSESQRLIE